MLPASEGDCLVLSYGATENQLRHVVIDGGRKATWPHLKKVLQSIAARGETVELLLLSHIDADHIDGLLELAQEANLPTVPQAVWYNGFDQIKGMIPPGGLQPQGFRVADDYSKALDQKGWQLNEEFNGKAICVDDRPDPFDFAGLTLTLISPTKAKLKKLWVDWEKWRDAHGLQPMGKRPMPATLDVDKLSGTSPGDTTAPNGSSVALIAEYDNRRVLLGADAHPDVLEATVGALAAGNGGYRVDLAKLPHHGSRANVTAKLLRKIDCNRFAISTSGAVFGHPDPEAISRVLKFGRTGKKTLFFNYASERTLPWNDDQLKAQWNYECVFPDVADSPISIDV